ncbi:hypothetical protein ACFZBU_12640 [Embleya sp. NPDC008237]|uniref:hypothetical protein n=1 Tax=Embleya sp. NPDC008237 TaxID=3363978 RepID=UPI0036E2258B
MNPDDKHIDQILGGRAAGALVNAWIDAFMTDDLLSRAAATRVACERLADRSPWLIAETGQTWRLRGDFTPTADFSPGLVRVLAVRHAVDLRPHEGTAAVLLGDAEHDPGHPIGWMDLCDFDILYALDGWPRPSSTTRDSDPAVDAASATEPPPQRLQEFECGLRDQGIE